MLKGNMLTGLALVFVGLLGAETGATSELTGEAVVKLRDAWSSMEVTIPSDTSSNGTAVSAGRYTIAWSQQIRGDECNETVVRLSQNGTLVVEIAARIVERQAPAVEDSIVSRRDAKGVNRLVEIHFRGDKSALVLTGS